MTTVDVAIIGAGPSGIAAAVQLKRYGFDPLVFEKDSVGGLLRNANLVENYPGFPGGVSGERLVSLMKEGYYEQSVKTLFETVTGLDYSDGIFAVTTEARTVGAHAVVIASGTRPVEVCDGHIPECISNRKLYEIHTIQKVIGKTVVIVGAGDAAFDYALNLGRHNHVLILNRTDRVKCLPLLRDRVDNSERIEYYADTAVEDVGASDGGRISVKYRHCGDISSVEADYIVYAAGREPELGFVSDTLKASMGPLKDNGLLYLIGDVDNGIYRQTSIAVGQGVQAAMEIYTTLKESTR